MKLPSGFTVVEESEGHVLLEFVSVVNVNVADELLACKPLKDDPVAITHVCELGENCRCVEGDEPGCWNWIEKVGL